MSDLAHPNAAAPLLARRNLAALLVILVCGGVLRIAWLDSVPPGLNQDEAANAWNAYCLLKTGRDQVGQPWPVFYARTLGENRSTLFFYWMIPFQALGGLTVWTTRLPAAVAGLLTIALLYYVAGRWFGARAGLLAAALLAISPWAIQQSRWGHEATIAPLLVTATIATMLWSGLPLSDKPAARPWAWRALLAGVLAGVSCYGYPALRIFIPGFLVLAALAIAGPLVRFARSAAGLRSLLAFTAGFVALFAPLAWQHVYHADQIARRASVGWAWSTDAGPAERLAAVARRYALHFEPKFLFREGEWSFATKTPHGALHWFTLPLLLTGTGVALARSRRSPAARVALVWLVAFPLGDCLNAHQSAHLLRSLPGLCAPVVLAGLGAAWGWERLQRWRPAAALAALAAGALAAGAELHRHASAYFDDFYRRPSLYGIYQGDLVEALRWLRPRVDRADAVFITSRAALPYITTLVIVGYDPRAWHDELRTVDSTGEWDQYHAFGKFNFLHDRSRFTRFVETAATTSPRERALLIIRPGEVDLGSASPALEVRNPAGQRMLLCYELEL